MRFQPYKTQSESLKESKNDLKQNITMAQLIDIKMDLAEAHRIVKAKIKSENKGKVIVIFKVGDTLKAYDEDAVAIAEHCGLAYNNVGTKDNCTITDITISSNNEFLLYPRMVKNGYKLCVIE